MYLKPAIDHLNIVHHVISLVEQVNATGARLINVVYEQYGLLRGYPKADALFRFILEKTCTPYLDILYHWLYHGVVYDPFGEFCIEDKGNEIDVYHRYSLKEDVPFFLKDDVARLYNTGKYCSILSSVGEMLKDYVDVEALKYSPKLSYYKTKINDVYMATSQRILEKTLVQHHLMEQLAYIKY